MIRSSILSSGWPVFRESDGVEDTQPHDMPLSIIVHSIAQSTRENAPLISNKQIYLLVETQVPGDLASDSPLAATAGEALTNASYVHSIKYLLYGIFSLCRLG